MPGATSPHSNGATRAYGAGRIPRRTLCCYMTLVHGDPAVLVPATNDMEISHYNLPPTVLDMYGLSPLGETAMRCRTGWYDSRTERRRARQLRWQAAEVRGGPS